MTRIETLPSAVQPDRLARIRPHLHRLPALVGLVMFALAVFVLHRAPADLTLADVIAEFHSIPRAHLVGALVLIVASYLLLTLYDVIGLRYVASTLRWAAVAPTAFLAFAVGHNVGVASLSGGAIRYRAYSGAGLSAASITQVVVSCTATFALGVAALLGLALLFEPANVLQSVRLPVTLGHLLGVPLLLVPLTWVAWAARGRPPLVIGAWRVLPPSLPLAVAQVRLSIVDLVIVAAMWLLGVGVFVSLLEGFDHEEAIVLSLAAALLYASRERFHRRASLLDEPFTWGWFASVAIVGGGIVWLGFFAYRHVDYSHDLRWNFTYRHEAPKMLRVTLLVAVLLVAFALIRLLRPTAPRRRGATAEDLELARAIIELGTSAEANVALTGDKDFLHLDTAVVRVDGHVVAFANLWRSGDGSDFSINLMRHGDAAPKGIMDYLFVELMLWGKAEGFGAFNLGMAPLSGLEHHPLATLWNRVGNLVFRFGDEFYNFDGLRKYEQKFHPGWEPRYLAAPGGLAPPRVLFDATTLISGGAKGVLAR